MKIFRTVALFILINNILFSQVSKYEEVSVLGEKVYFPKKTSEYLIELLENENIETYYDIAKVYITLHEFSAAENFVKQYELESDNYLKISELYHLMSNYNKEIEFIDKYLENPLEHRDILTYSDYSLKLINEKNLDIPIEKYNLSKLERLSIYLDNPSEYYDYFIANEWNEQEKIYIVNEIKGKKSDLPFFTRILIILASSEEIEEIYYENISSIVDITGYSSYFTLLEQNSNLNSFRNDFEKFHYLRHKNDITFEFYKEKLAYDLAVKEDERGLQSLYRIEPDFKLLYNLALVNDKSCYEFILNRINSGLDEENILKLIDIFNINFPESEFLGDILKLKLDYIVAENERLELIDNYLNSNSDIEKNIDFILMKLEILLAQDKKKLAEEIVSKLIFSSYEKRELIEFYSNLLEQTGRVEELIVNLKKLNDKSYYIEKSVHYSYSVDKIYEDVLISYYFEKGEYQNLLDYKDKLTFEMYDKLLKSGWSEFLEAALSNYSLREEWIDKHEFKYFFFDQAYDYKNEFKITEIFEKAKRTDAETYYLAKYYELIGDFEKSSELLEELEKEYILSEI